MMNILYSILAIAILLLALFFFWRTYQNAKPPNILLSGLWEKYRWPVIVFILVIAGIHYAYQRVMNAEALAEQAKQLSQQQTQAAGSLKNELDISKANAQNLADSIAKIAAGQTQPNTTFYVTAPTVQAAADQVQEKINDHNTTLPSVVLEKTDRTVVTPVIKDSTGNTLPAEQQKVDVYKITLDKARWGLNALVLTGDGTEIGAGPSWKNRDNAVNIGVTNKKRTYLMGTHYY